MKPSNLEKQVDTLIDLVAENKELRNQVNQLKHLRKMDLEFLCILVWGYGIDKHKYNSMDKRIYSGYSTYLKRAYDWDWLMEFVIDDKTDAIFDRIELINNEVRRDGNEKRKKVLELYKKREEERKEKEEKEKIVLTLTPEIIEKQKNGKQDETK